MLDRRGSPDGRSLDPWPPADPLGATLHLLRMSGAFYCRSDLSAPWGLTLPPMPRYIWFHVLAEGLAWLEAGAGDGAWLRPGELALVPHGEGHTLRSEPETPAPPILELPLERVSDRYELLRHGGGGAPTLLVCGAVRFDHPSARSLVAMLPPVVRIDHSVAPRPDFLQSTLALMAAEARELRPGGEAVMTRLADILVVQAIRSWLETDPGARTGWLAALRDPQVGRALALVHRDPARAWTVAELAREVAMSRSAFAA
ncbi:MAG TPA: cupin domain-containing protein, partial [Gaiellaceae bacterium]|nr:cupin domain-containing protein [Gaiellaceae bacterium]